MTHPLDAPLGPLVQAYRRLATRGQPMVLATVVATAGSTYRKAGAQMLIAAGGQLSGLLSGGCLEVDLIEHAAGVLATGQARLLSYDMRNADDLLFGIGAGCEGAMEILLQRVGPAEDWQPLQGLANVHDEGIASALALTLDGASAGSAHWPGGVYAGLPAELQRALAAATGSGQPVELVADLGGQATRVAVLPLPAAPRLLLLGGGPDAVPIARLATEIGFAVTVADHRPAYARAERFPGSQVRHVDPARIAATIDLPQFAAAVVMSHNLAADQAYLQALAEQPVAYVGLLGPAARRERLLSAIGSAAGRLQGRLRGPVGLDIGARTPEAIALAVVAELHAALAGRGGRPFSDTAEGTGL